MRRANLPGVGPKPIVNEAEVGSPAWAETSQPDAIISADASVSTVDVPRVEFLDRLTPRQAVLLHYFWSLSADALSQDYGMFWSRLAWLSDYATKMRSTAEGQRQIDLITARISGLAHQLTEAEMEELGIGQRDAPDAEVKCIRCGCTENRACEGGCSWASTDPPICSRCV